MGPVVGVRVGEGAGVKEKERGAWGGMGGRKGGGRKVRVGIGEVVAVGRAGGGWEVQVLMLGMRLRVMVPTGGWKLSTRLDGRRRVEGARTRMVKV